MLPFNIIADGYINHQMLKVKKKKLWEFTATNIKVNKEEDPKTASSCNLPGHANSVQCLVIELL